MPRKKTGSDGVSVSIPDGGRGMQGSDVTSLRSLLAHEECRAATVVCLQFLRGGRGMQGRDGRMAAIPAGARGMQGRDGRMQSPPVVEGCRDQTDGWWLSTLASEGFQMRRVECVTSSQARHLTTACLIRLRIAKASPCTRDGTISRRAETRLRGWSAKRDGAPLPSRHVKLYATSLRACLDLRGMSLLALHLTRA
ncbi:hypothetical protein J2R96_002116 [Bradyrhizobium elkanii]|nr:hypothetical protein [Bradyrhizobium elkanii]